MKTDRVLCKQLENKIITDDEAASLIKSGMTICVNGFTQDYPKAIPIAVERLHTADKLTLISGATGGDRLTEILTNSGQLSRFSAFQFNRDLRNAINNGKVSFVDCHLSQLAEKLENGFFGKIDFAILECCKINADGGIVPSLSGNIAQTILRCAENVLIEINTNIPLEAEGFHDFPFLGSTLPKDMMERAGESVVRCDVDKIAGVVFTDEPLKSAGFPDTNEIFSKISENIVRLLYGEISANRLPEQFTFQSGMGVVANAVIIGLTKQGFTGLKMYTELLTQAAFDALRAGAISAVATNSVDLDKEGYDELLSNLEYYKKHIVIRPLDVINGAAEIRSQGLVSMNTAVEADIYGNVNSTHALGTKMLNGIGGSNDFCRSAKLSIFSTPSVSGDGAISCIVPMVSHVDSTEHDTDILVTEYGYADLRGKCPRERVGEIIDNCAHPDYRRQLWDYYNNAVAVSGHCQTPHDLSKALSWHQRFLDTGTMKE